MALLRQRLAAVRRYLSSLFLGYMHLFLSSFVIFTLVGAGCSPVSSVMQVTSTAQQITSEPIMQIQEPLVVAPLGCQMDFKGFGEYIQDRFRGYHTGIDCEQSQVDLEMHRITEVPVHAAADGRVTFVGRTSGYGGVIVLSHILDGEVFSTLYGHLDLGAVPLRIGDAVYKGNRIANLGADRSTETDGERMHLHFGVWRGDAVKLAGYVKTPAELSGWLNPFAFLITYGSDAARNFVSTETNLFIPGKDSFDSLALDIPEGLQIEYIPSLDAVNLYTAAGEGSARGRSQFFLRYFNASDFLTLGTVTVLETRETTVGREKYKARQYRIEKKASVPVFADQPSWRNVEHTVTDFRDKEGKTRYWVIAANPDGDTHIYEKLLESVEIPKE